MNTTFSVSVVRLIRVVPLLLAMGTAVEPRGLAAEPREHWEGPRAPLVRRAPEFRHEWPGDMNRFHGVVLPRWRTGHWFHGGHLGRAGWWWVVDGDWYFYPAPIYPYPDPYVPPGLVVAGPPPAPAPATPPYWYYCPSAQAYYPYVSACPEGWTPVVPPAGPPGS
jgi:hypothetical protein